MARFDFQSGVMFALALTAAGVLGYGVSQVGDAGGAEAAPVLMRASASASMAAGQAAQIARANDGHYWAEADINGRAVRVLVDTGASVVALTRDDAARLGLRLEPADFSATVVTASGPVRAAAVELQAVAVAGARVDRVEALVVEAGLPHSLLGMSYLGRLSSFSATPAGLTLRP